MTNHSPRRRSEEQFGQRAAAYAVSRSHSAGESLRQVEALVMREELRFRRAVDIATGTGFTAFAIAPYVDQVVATDLTPQMLEEARRLRSIRNLDNVELALAAAEDLPFASNSLGLVTCRIAPHHFIHFNEWISEVERVLQPGGVFIACDTAAPEDKDMAEWMNYIEVQRDPSHVRNLAPSEWRRVVTAVGLTVTDLNLCYTWHEFNDWTERAGMADDDRERLRADFLRSGKGQSSAFNLIIDPEGSIQWSWDAVVLRAVKGY